MKILPLFLPLELIGDIVFVKVAVIESDSWENHAKMKILPLFLPLELIGGAQLREVDN